MTNRLLKLTYGALLHDIGKVVQRATQERKTHSRIGADWFEEQIVKDKAISQQIRYHHAREIPNHLENDNLAFITYFADNIASGLDRRTYDEDETGYTNWDTFTNSEDIFNVFGEQKTRRYYEPSMLDDHSGHMNLADQTKGKYSKGKYAEIQEKIRQHLASFDYEDAKHIQSLLNLLEASLSYVPSSTNQDEVRDISLYDHSKMVAAFATALYQYFEAQGVRDYRNKVFKNGDFSMYDEAGFVLASFDISGIQDFIYTISSAGAMKQLKARSFYLDMLSEYIADRLLAEFDLSRCNLIYNGGGHAYFILPNLADTAARLQAFEHQVNADLLSNFKGKLYVAIGYTPFAANDVMLQYKQTDYEDLAKRQQALYQQVSEMISRKKLQRYDAKTLIALNQQLHESETECATCHSTMVSQGKLCDICDRLDKLAAQMGSSDHHFVVNADASGLPLIGDAYLHVASQSAIQQNKIQGHVYAKNKFLTGDTVLTHLWLADYQAAFDISQYVKREVGIKRLAVLRCDVDDLGYAFMAGFGQLEQGKYQTFSRSATFSRQMSLFFKHYLNNMANGKQLTIVYSGGDDVFALGKYDDVLEFYVDLQDQFSRWTQGKLTLSAGIALVTAKTPVNILAHQAGQLESSAKDYQDGQKNAVSLFDSNYTFNNLAFKAIYTDTLGFVRDFFQNQNQDSQDQERGKAFIYKILSLIRETPVDKHGYKQISFARLVYLLTRLEPKDAEGQAKFRHFSDRLVQMLQDQDQQQALEMALTLYIYEIRKD